MKKFIRAIFQKIALHVREAVYEPDFLLYRVNKNISVELQRRALQTTAEYVEQHMLDAPSFDKKESVLALALETVKIDGLYLEFGVYNGHSINTIASRINKRIYGFDSFEGLPEFWRQGYGKGKFRVDGLPAVRDSVVLVKGWFNDTLPVFLAEHSEPVAFLHIDSDLYSSAKTIFELLDGRIISGTVIVFDELFNYPGWQQGEAKALTEFLEKSGKKAKFIGYSSRYEQAALIIL